MNQTTTEGAAPERHDLIATRYMYRRDFNTFDVNPVMFERMRSHFYKGERWAVRQGSFCLDRDGDWEHEPSPSSRDAKFYARCRFETLNQAVATLEAPSGSEATKSDSASSVFGEAEISSPPNQ